MTDTLTVLLTVPELARHFDRSCSQVRYAIRILEVKPRTVIRPFRYNPAELVPALGNPPLRDAE